MAPTHNRDKRFIPYGRHCVDEDDIASVVDVLRSDWLTTGPAVERFERHVSSLVDVRNGAAVSSGTAALHAMLAAVGVGKGDEVIVPPLTFAATANAVLYNGGTPVFADVEMSTGLLCADAVEAAITDRTRAIIGVDWSGQPCDYPALRAIADRYEVFLLADCAHSLGAHINGRPVATFVDAAVFSFHPVKHITTGEGGMVVSNDDDLIEYVRRFRNHGIDVDAGSRDAAHAWFYQMIHLGYNYRLTDLQSIMGVSQLRKLERWMARRREVATRYNDRFRKLSCFDLFECRSDVQHAWHLYPLRLESRLDEDHRALLFDQLRRKQIGVNVHYIPVYRHPYYRDHLGYASVQCLNAEAICARIVSLPLYGTIEDDDVKRVIDAVVDITSGPEFRTPSGRD